MKKIILLIPVLAAAISCLQQKTIPDGNRVQALPDEAWNSSVWISAADAPAYEGKIENDRSVDGASWFVSVIKNEKVVKKAVWMTSGLGVYDIYVNGHLVGDEVLKPGFTHFAKTKRSFTYDVTSLFDTSAEKENVIAAQVTPGWWADKIVTSGGVAGGQGRKPAFRGVLEVTYSDGHKVLYGTDTEHWKAGVAGPVTHAAIFDGEEYDARIPMGYDTVGKLGVPEENTEFHGEILPSDGAEVYQRRDIALSPVEAYVWEGVTGAVESNNSEEVQHGKVIIKRSYKQGETMTVAPGETLVVDFGQNASAVPSFVFKAAEGTKLTCLPSEILNDGNGAESRGMDGPEGSVHRRNLRAYEECFILSYIFAANEDFVSYTPRATFFGYRYISVTADGPVEISSVKSIPVTSIAQNLETGKIETGNELVNKLISNTYWGQLSNYLSVPTDCPQRNERLGWMADTQVFTETGTFFANTDSFFHKWLRDVRDSQSETGGYGHVNPRVGCCHGENASAWADAGVIIPYNMYRMYGDKTILEEHYASMEKYIAGLVEKNGLSGADPIFGDWLAYDKCSNKFISSVYFIRDLELMEYIGKELGKPGKAAKYAKLREDALGYFRKKFMRRGKLKGTSQTEKVLCLAFGIITGKEADALAEALAKQIAENGDRLSTGFLGTYNLCPTLSAFGKDKTAYNLLLQRNEPSWLYSVDQGATTIWERWNSYTKAKGFGDVGMNSFNHYAYGSIVEWIYRYAAGIEPAAPGFTAITLQPTPDLRTDAELPAGQERITYIKAEYDSAAGLIKSAWNTENGFVYTCTVPEGADATLLLPVTADTLTVNGVSHAGAEYEVKDGRYVIALAPGAYEFKQEK